MELRLETMTEEIVGPAGEAGPGPGPSKGVFVENIEIGPKCWRRHIPGGTVVVLEKV